MHPDWQYLRPGMTLEHLGYIPYWLNTDDPDGAVEQIDKHYAHGGGWFDFKGFRMDNNGTLLYPGDPPLKPLAKARLREETIYFYDHAIVAIAQPNGEFRAARID